MPATNLKALLEVAQTMGRLRAPYFFSGGWAIDLHLGRVTREHHDIDVLVMRRDHLGLHKALKEFSLKKIIPHPDGMPPNLGTIVEWPRRRAARTSGASDKCVSRGWSGAGVPGDARGIE